MGERNVQLGVFGAFMALAAALWQDGPRILEAGFTQGYSWRVVCVILNNALGGLLCAAVLKYADNILRCFSTALSIILTCMLSAWGLQEYEPDFIFIIGATLAILATFSYNLGPQYFVRHQNANGNITKPKGNCNIITTNGSSSGNSIETIKTNGHVGVERPCSFLEKSTPTNGTTATIRSRTNGNSS